MKSLSRSIHLPVWLSQSAWIVPIVLSASPALSATTITARYGIFEQSVSVNSLRIYAEQNRVEPDLRILLRSIDSSQLRSLLLAKVDLSALTVAQFLYTPEGERLLSQIGTMIQTDANLSGVYGLRAAMIQAADEPEGLTLLNVIEQFPLSDIRVDLDPALQLSQALETLIRQSQTAIDLVAQQANLEATAQPWNPAAARSDLRSPGSFTWQQLTIEVNNPQRDRPFPTDLYLPQTTAPVPVVVISHGLGSDRSAFVYLAEQLASYGFAVAVPDHPGSDAQHIQALASGEANQVADPSEFIDRPLDVKYLLDRLTFLSQSHLIPAQLDLQQVGVIGQSFGGYTALALAGARLNVEQLAAACSTRDDLLNLSLLLECRAQQLPQPLPNLKDDRVKAIIAMNPIGSSLFGASGFATLSVPTLIVSGSNDVVAPALLEQIRPFTWLQSQDKYLALLQGGTHFSTIDATDSDSDAVDLPSSMIGPDPAIANTYLKAISVAFFESYLTGNSYYRNYLTSAYAQTISQSLMPIDLVRSLPATEIAQVFDESAAMHPRR